MAAPAAALRLSLPSPSASVPLPKVSTESLPPADYFDPRKGIATPPLDADSIFEPCSRPRSPPSASFLNPVTASPVEWLVVPQSTSQTWPQFSRDSPARSPRGIQPRLNSSPVYPISLPASSTTNGAMGEVLATPKQPGLIRRVSQRAADRLRRRTLSTSLDGERSGPVVMRHRSASASTGGIDGARGLGIQHYDSLDDDEDATVAVIDQLDGYNTDKGSTAPAVDGSVGIVVPEELQRGTAMTRVTRKKKVQRIFKLDVNTARVSWDPAKQTSCFYVDDMKDVRTGANARNYREELQVSSDLEDRWITIIYVDTQENSKLKLLHVIATSVELFSIWTSTLEAIHRYRTEMMAGLAMQGEKFVDAHWRNYMANQRGANPSNLERDRLELEDVEVLCRRLHVNCSRRFLKEKFRRADRDNSGYLNFQEFQHFVKLLKERDEIKDLWEGIVANPHIGMDRTEFRDFLRDSQKVDVEADSTQVDKVFRKFCRKSTRMNQVSGDIPTPAEDIKDMHMNREAFTAFLLSSSYNPPLLNTPADANFDRPLNEYYCSSSHNTYLMGRQVRGESSVEGYIRVLQRGCRCVEIDCWDGDDGRPVVTHGRTGTSECLFSDVIHAIGKYAFLASPYPVILSLEVHCNREQQVKMAEVLVNLLGDKLLMDPLITNSLTLPSPQELKHRILVKVKGSERKDTSALTSEFNMDKKASNSSTRTPGFLRSNSSSSSGITTTDTDEPSGGSGDKKTPKPATKIAHELGVLGVYYRGQKFRNFALPESKTFNHVFSFQEKSFLKFCKDPEKKVQLEKHNIRYLLRVYPSGFRVNSSNFDPLGFWRRGVQMVALNWQTYDLGIQLNEAMFAAGSDRSGFVLKPKALRGSRSSLDPPADAAAAKLKKDKKEVKFSIEVISAQQLPRPKDHKADESIDPFVEVEVFSADDKTKGTSTSEGGIDLSTFKGVSGLGAPQKRRSKVVRDDGFHPLFGEKMKFSLVTKFEDLVFVRFSVYNAEGADDKSLIATYTAKLISMQQGYRHLPLYDIQGEQYLFSTLFVKVNVEPVTLIDRELPEPTSAIENFKSTAKSVFTKGFSSERRSVRRKKSDRESEASGGDQLHPLPDPKDTTPSTTTGSPRLLPQ